MLALTILLMAPRGAEGEAPALRLHLQQAFVLEDSRSLAPGDYEFAWTGTELVAVETATRQEVLRVAMTAKPRVGEGPDLAVLTFDKHTHHGAILVRWENGEVWLSGALASAQKQPTEVLADSQAASLPASAPIVAPDPVQTLWQTRFLPQVAHCVRYKGAAYEKCMCPVVQKLRFPPTAGVYVLPSEGKPVQVELDPKGRVKTCVVK